MTNDNHGITGAINEHLGIYMTIVAFSAIALYNVFELSVIIFATFKQRRGLYFWSFIIATWGIVPHTLGFILQFFGITFIWWFNCTIVGIGWFCMVSGQAFVLYSRLHLVVREEWRVRWVLYMILFNFVAIGIPLMTLALLVNRPIIDLAILKAFIIFDKVQLGIFVLQESVISILYIYETMKLLRPMEQKTDSPVRKLLKHLILVNVVVLIFDATLLGTQYSGNYEIQTTYKPAIYSIKLKIEFSILNQLAELVKNRGSDFSRQLSRGTVEESQLQDMTKVANDTRNKSVGGSTLRNKSVDDGVKYGQRSGDSLADLIEAQTDWSDRSVDLKRPNVNGGVFVGV